MSPFIYVIELDVQNQHTQSGWKSAGGAGVARPHSHSLKPRSPGLGVAAGTHKLVSLTRDPVLDGGVANKSPEIVRIYSPTRR